MKRRLLFLPQILLVAAIASKHLARASAQMPTQTTDRLPPEKAAPAAPNPLAASFEELLRRSSNGHSPAPEEIAALSSSPHVVDAAALREALPLIERSLANPDSDVRAYALATLESLQSAPLAPAEPEPRKAATAVPAADPGAGAAAAQPAVQTVAPPPPGPAAYKPELARVLAPDIPKIAAHLTDDSPANRMHAAIILGGFTPEPPAAVYPPLFAFLKRDDAIGRVGLAVVNDLLQLGPLNADTGEAISRFLRRSDQTTNSRANLVDAIASSSNQNAALNKALLAFLDSDDPGLRARVILSLPQLDLTPEVFADTRARVATFAGNDGENLQVVNAAKAVAPCWTATRMAAGCPVYQ